MSKIPVQNDLMQFSKTESADEERLLQLYRNCSDSERNEILYRVTRLRFAPSFGAWAQSNGYVVNLSDADEHLHEELEEGLRDICPRELLREVGAAMTDQQFNGFWQGAWGSIAPVIFGTSERDGQMADKLYAEVAGTAPSVWRGKFQFSRREALELIETWREAALQRAFTG
jgi:hypothetical protein